MIRITYEGPGWFRINEPYCFTWWAPGGSRGRQIHYFLSPVQWGDEVIREWQNHIFLGQKQSAALSSDLWELDSGWIFQTWKNPKRSKK